MIQFLRKVEIGKEPKQNKPNRNLEILKKPTKLNAKPKIEISKNSNRTRNFEYSPISNTKYCVTLLWYIFYCSFGFRHVSITYLITTVSRKTKN